MLRIILLSFLGVIGSAIVARSQDSLLLHAIRDAIVVYHDGYPSGLRNYGSTDTYSAVCQPGAIWGVNSSRTFFQFDLSEVPAGANIVRAELNLFGRCCVRDAGLVS